MALVSSPAELRPAWLGGGSWWIPLDQVPQVVARLGALLLAVARRCADPALPDELLVRAFECSRALGELAGDLGRLDLHPWPDLLDVAALPGEDSFHRILARLEGELERGDSESLRLWRRALGETLDELDTVSAGLVANPRPGQANLVAWAERLASATARWRSQLGLAGGARGDDGDR